MTKIILGVIMLVIFFLAGSIVLKSLAVVFAVLLLPYKMITVLPVVLIYDTVFRSSGVPTYSIATVLIIILFYIIKPYIRK